MPARERHTFIKQPGDNPVGCTTHERAHGGGPGAYTTDYHEPDEYLPVAYVSDKHDAGAWEEGDAGVKEPTAYCPHCGSPGRYIYRFTDMGGNEWRAMSGCVEAWPGGKDHARQYDLGQADLDTLRDAGGDHARLVAVGAFDQYGWPAREIASPFLREMLNSLQHYGRLSDKQVALALRIIDEGRHTVDERAEREAERAREDAERRAKGGAVVAAKGATITGTILTLRHEVGFYGPTTKWMVEAADGCRYWGTMPSAALDMELDKGMTVTFTANVEPSNDDPMFGFTSRPRKVQAL